MAEEATADLTDHAPVANIVFVVVAVAVLASVGLVACFAASVALGAVARSAVVEIFVVVVAAAAVETFAAAAAGNLVAALSSLLEVLPVVGSCVVVAADVVGDSGIPYRSPKKIVTERVA